MTDHFAVLGQPRRPWLDPNGLKREYQRLASEHHPDRKNLGTDSSSRPGESSSTFAAVNEAYRVLSNPRLRLQHLLSLEGSGALDSQSSDVAADLGDVFMEAATFINEVGAYLQKREQITSTLGKSLLRAETAEFQKRADALLKRLQQVYDQIAEDLHRADELWTADRARSVDQLRSLADRFGYLESWIGQLREKQFQLST